jgi:hypothetical protein
MLLNRKRFRCIPAIQWGTVVCFALHEFALARISLTTVLDRWIGAIAHYL